MDSHQLGLAAAAWRLKRAQTDPDFSVLLDALLAGESEERVRAVAAASSGRVVVERPLTKGLTAVLWQWPRTQVWRAFAQSDEAFRAQIREAMERDARDQRVLLVSECRLEESRSGHIVVLPPNTQIERDGRFDVIDVYDERGDLLVQFRSPRPQTVVRGQRYQAIIDVPGIKIAEISGALNQALRSQFGPQLDLSSGSLVGQLVGVLSDRHAALWEQMERIHASNQPDTATSEDLDALARLL